jgi:hypothetical protein
MHHQAPITNNILTNEFDFIFSPELLDLIQFFLYDILLR